MPQRRTLVLSNGRNSSGKWESNCSRTRRSSPDFVRIRYQWSIRYSAHIKPKGTRAAKYGSVFEERFSKTAERLIDVPLIVSAHSGAPLPQFRRSLCLPILFKLPDVRQFDLATFNSFNNIFIFSSPPTASFDAAKSETHAFPESGLDLHFAAP